MGQLTSGNTLASALRSRASEVRGVYSESPVDNQVLRDAASLLRVLANVVEGMPLLKALGAPGDWGYDTAIGRGVLELHRSPCLPACPESGKHCNVVGGECQTCGALGVQASAPCCPPGEPHDFLCPNGVMAPVECGPLTDIHGVVAGEATAKPAEYTGVRCMCVLTGCKAGPGCPHYCQHCRDHIAHTRRAPSTNKDPA